MANRFSPGCRCCPEQPPCVCACCCYPAVWTIDDPGAISPLGRFDLLLKAIYGLPITLTWQATPAECGAPAYQRNPDGTLTKITPAARAWWSPPASRPFPFFNGSSWETVYHDVYICGFISNCLLVIIPVFCGLPYLGQTIALYTTDNEGLAQIGGYYNTCDPCDVTQFWMLDAGGGIATDSNTGLELVFLANLHGTRGKDDVCVDSTGSAGAYAVAP